MKDLEARLARAQSQASEGRERERGELRRVAGELEAMRKAVGEREVNYIGGERI